MENSELYEKNPVHALSYLHECALYCAEGMDGEEEQSEMYELINTAYLTLANIVSNKE